MCNSKVVVIDVDDQNRIVRVDESSVEALGLADCRIEFFEGVPHDSETFGVWLAARHAELNGGRDRIRLTAAGGVVCAES